MKKKTLVVVGGGAAGFFCAVNAARENTNLEVIILEKTTKLLSKVKISGGGRCNVTHALFDIAALSKRYPRGQHFVKKTFHQFSTTDTIQWFEKRGVQLHAERDGRMFPVTNDSQTIIDCLMREAGQYGVEIRTASEVKSFKPAEENFVLELSDNRQLNADFVCIATGGYPKAAMFQWLKDAGHNFSEPVPSLFTFNLPNHPIRELMGVSIEQARVKIANSKLVEEGPVLITHWGLSGPAVLRLSAWGARELAANNYHFKAHINWMTEYNEQSAKAFFQQLRKDQPTKKMANLVVGDLPNRLWAFLLLQSGIDAGIRLADLPAKQENALIKNLVDYVVEVKGKTTFKEEFVTAGGITLGEVDSATLMSRKIPNLFFAGEVLDVDGITGGFNFQHAWTSGWIVAHAIARLHNGFAGS